MPVCSPAAHRKFKNNFTNCRFGLRNISAGQLLHAPVFYVLSSAREGVGGMGVGGGGRAVVLKGSMPPTNTNRNGWTCGLWWRANSWRKLIYLQQTDLYLQLGDRISREGDREHWSACLCVFVCSPRVYLGLAGLWGSQGVAYQKDYPSAGKYCRYKGQVFFGGEGSKSVLIEQQNWD